MALFPVQGVVEGDFVVLLVAVDDEDPMGVVAEKIAYHAVNRRVAARAGSPRVRHNGKELDPQATVVTAGVGPMDVLEITYS